MKRESVKVTNELNGSNIRTEEERINDLIKESTKQGIDYELIRNQRGTRWKPI